MERNISVADFMNNWNIYDYGATIGSTNPSKEKTKRIIVSMYISNLYSPSDESSGFIFGMSVGTSELGFSLGNSYAVEFNRWCWNPITCSPTFEESIDFKKRIIYFAKKDQETSGFSFFNSWKEQDLNIKIKISFINDVKATNIIDIKLPGITLTKADFDILPSEFSIANYLKDLITEDDETAYSSYEYQGKNWVDIEEVIDSKGNTSINNYEFYQYRIYFEDALPVTISVLSTDYNQENSLILAQAFGKMLGRLPFFNRSKVNNLHIIKNGLLPSWYYSDETDAITIIASMTNNFEIFEELLLHETCHIALDDSNLYNDDWFSAEYLDNKFISQYASSIYSIDNPPFNREDHAESYLAWIASRFRTNRFNTDKIQFIENQIPNRLSFYDSYIPQGNLYPIIGTPNNRKIFSYGIDSLPIEKVNLYPNPSNGKFNIEIYLKEANLVNFKIIDINEKLVFEQKNKPFEKGNNSFEINLENKPPSGLYFLKVDSKEFSETFKIIIE